MANLKNLVILSLIQLALTEDRISVNTVGSITATAGYLVSDNHSPTVSSLTSNLDFGSDHDSSKDASSSSEAYTSSPVIRNTQSLALRSRQARGKPSQWKQSGSVEEKDTGIVTFPLNEHRVNEQLYSVKPQTFDNQQVTDNKSNESNEQSVPSITYGKKMHKNDEHDDRPVFNNWSEEVHMKFNNDKPIRPRKKNKHQEDSSQEKRKPQTNKLTNTDSDNKDGWQEVSPNMEIATGFSTTVQENDSSLESSVSSESFHTHPDVYHSETISSIENASPAEPQNFNHKQVLSKMNHFDFSNAVSQANKLPPPREKRLNYQQSVGGPSPIRYAYSGQTLQTIAPSAVPLSLNGAVVKSVKIEQPTPNYHSIVVPIPISHQMYAAISGDSSSAAHGHQLASSTIQQAMMSLPVVHNVFFKTDENGGGKTMPAIVIPLKPEYLQHLQQQQYIHVMQQQQQSSEALTAETQNAAGHQRPGHQGAAGIGNGPKTLQYQQQQNQQQQMPYQQKPKPAKAKKPFGLNKDENRVKQPFSLQQHQFYNNNHQFSQQHGNGLLQQQPYHSHHVVQHQQHDTSDDSRYAPTAVVPGSSTVHQFPVAGGHSLIVKRPHAYGYATPKYTAVSKTPPNHHYQQQQISDEELATAIVQQQQLQQQQQQQQPYKATTYHPAYSYLNGPEDDYAYRPIYKDVKKRNDDVRSE